MHKIRALVIIYWLGFVRVLYINTNLLSTILYLTINDFRTTRVVKIVQK